MAGRAALSGNASLIVHFSSLAFLKGVFVCACAHAYLCDNMDLYLK